MTKEEAKQKIAALVAKYKSMTASEVKKHNEEATKQGFILPLFRALGWNVEDTVNEVVPEENASKGRVDYAFKLNGVAQFYLEAKPLKADLNNPVFIKQAVTYAYNKGVTWAILTDFEGLRLFNAQKNTPYLNLSYQDYIPNSDKLWLLSRASLEQGLLNKEAAKVGALPPSLPIEKRLFSQLRQWREELFNQLRLHNESLTFNQADEVIQRLFNRLIFIRTCEDRNIEERRLLAAVHQWVSGGHKKDKLAEALRQIFHEFDGYYDSELFAAHIIDSDQLFIEELTVEGILSGLYDIPGGMASYDFSLIDADVLGQVYEQYLGYVAGKAKEKPQSQMTLGLAGGTQVEFAEKKAHRKEQGIYYTPKFVTNYIVKETVGRFLQERSYNEVRNMKILDPTCGSVSFLIRAYDELLNYHAAQRGKSADQLDQFDRMPILTGNIFGVDLDRQAVEIARLNLLLRSLAKRETLPTLSDNIRQGNSLISGTEDELKGYFGDSWQEKRPFNWQEEFADIMKNGGFDVVLGNPPWGGDIDRELEFFHAKYISTTQEHTDSFKLFIEASIRLARTGGLVSLIVPNTLLWQRRLRDVRSLLMENQMLALVDLGENVFKGVTAPSCIFVVRKGKPTDNHHVSITDLSKLPTDAKIDALSTGAKGIVCEQRQFLDNADLEFVAVPNRYIVPVVRIGDFDQVVCKDAGINYQRVDVGMQEKGKGDLANRLLYEGKRQNKQDKMYWKGTDIDRYWIEETTQRYCHPDFNAFIRSGEVVRLNKDVYRTVPKILLRQTADHIIATIDYRGYGLVEVLSLSY